MYEILFRGKRTDNDEGEFVYGIPVEGEPLLDMGKRTYIITKPGVQWVDGDIRFSDKNCVTISCLDEYKNYFDIIGNIHDNPKNHIIGGHNE